MIKSFEILATLLTVFLSFPAFAVNWNAVTDKETKAAACLDLQATSDHEMQDFLESRIDDLDLRISRTVRGVYFKNEIPEMIELFEGIHRPTFFYNQALKDLPKTSCQTVMCAMKQYYGPKTPLAMLYIYAKFGLSTSPEASGNQADYQPWKFEELQDALVALESLPPSVLPLKDHHLLHFLKGYTLGTYGQEGAYVVANARIDVFDLWNQQTRGARIADLVHELGHLLGMKLDDTPEWKAMPKEPISEYSKTNNGEDFAETFLAYRFAPQKLRKVSPKRYEFVKEKVFNGLEFNSTKDCEGPFLSFDHQVESKIKFQRELVAWTQSKKDEIATEVRRQEKMGSFVNQAVSFCGQDYLKELTEHFPREVTDSCISALIIKRAAAVEMRAEHREEVQESKIPVGQLSGIAVQRNVIGLVRQQMRHKYVVKFADIYGDRNFTPHGAEKHLCKYIFNKESHEISELEMAILGRACEVKAEGSLFKLLFEPDFNKMLP